MKRQFLALLVILVTLIVLSFYAATKTNLSKIESSISGDNSHQGGEGIIEGQGLLPYVVITGLLLAVGALVYWFLEQRKAH